MDDEKEWTDEEPSTEELMQVEDEYEEIFNPDRFDLMMMIQDRTQCNDD